ncbi:MAG TPA: DUF4411 family protein [Candidatus Nitrosotalea sp.]|nr:DUF4411 family protein [Candidatus Nitrosotalea sp.]
MDANIFIQAKNLQYGFDFCPAFWQWLLAANSANVVFSIEEIGNELKVGKDQLASWAAARDNKFFLEPNAAVVGSLTATSTWVANSGFAAAAVNTFLGVADYQLVARAHADGHTVVTHEVLDGSTKRIKIPLACQGLGVKWMTPYQMLSAEKAEFVLGPNSKP